MGDKASTASDGVPHQVTDRDSMNHTTHEMTSRVKFGAQQMQTLCNHMTNFDRTILMCSIFLVAYTFTLMTILSSVYEPVATASFQSHSFLTTVNVLQAATSVAALTTVGKLVDLFGRMTVVTASTVLIPLGNIVQATANSRASFAVGAVFYQLGFTCIVTSTIVIIADTTSLRSRLFFQYIPVLPALINTWAAGNLSSAVLRTTGWRWGVGMWSLIFPVATIPLLYSLWSGYRRANKPETPFPPGAEQNRAPRSLRSSLMALFRDLDTVGTILLVASLLLLLVPLSLASNTTFNIQWGSPIIITPLIAGALMIPVWLLWETRCQQPLVPFQLLKDRTIWSAFIIGILFETSFALQAPFLYTYLIVAVDESIMSATRIAALYHFVVAVAGMSIGLAVYFKFCRLKLLIVLGNVLFTAGFGVLAYVRGSISTSSHRSIIASQVFLGIGGSMYIYPIQVTVQAACRHENIAVVMSLFSCCNCIGVALGNSIAGAIWNQLLPVRLVSALEGINADADADAAAALSAFRDPFAYTAMYPPGTPQRDAVAESYAYVQWVICLVGVGTGVAQVLLSLFLRDPKLGEKQSLEGNKGSESALSSS